MLGQDVMQRIASPPKKNAPEGAIGVSGAGGERGRLRLYSRI